MATSQRPHKALSAWALCSALLLPLPYLLPVVALSYAHARSRGLRVPLWKWVGSASFVVLAAVPAGVVARALHHGDPNWMAGNGGAGLAALLAAAAVFLAVEVLLFHVVAYLNDADDEQWLRRTLAGRSFYVDRGVGAADGCAVRRGLGGRRLVPAAAGAGLRAGPARRAARAAARAGREGRQDRAAALRVVATDRGRRAAALPGQGPLVERGLRRPRPLQGLQRHPRSPGRGRGPGRARRGARQRAAVPRPGRPFRRRGVLRLPARHAGGRGGAGRGAAAPGGRRLRAARHRCAHDRQHRCGHRRAPARRPGVHRGAHGRRPSPVRGQDVRPGPGLRPRARPRARARR